jgi:hypothetical protein
LSLPPSWVRNYLHDLFLNTSIQKSNANYSFVLHFTYFWKQTWRQIILNSMLAIIPKCNLLAVFSCMQFWFVEFLIMQFSSRAHFFPVLFPKSLFRRLNLNIYLHKFIIIRCAYYDDNELVLQGNYCEWWIERNLKGNSFRYY